MKRSRSLSKHLSEASSLAIVLNLLDEPSEDTSVIDDDCADVFEKEIEKQREEQEKRSAKSAMQSFAPVVTIDQPRPTVELKDSPNDDAFHLDSLDDSAQSQEILFLLSSSAIDATDKKQEQDSSGSFFVYNLIDVGKPVSNETSSILSDHECLQKIQAVYRELQSESSQSGCRWCCQIFSPTYSESIDTFSLEQCIKQACKHKHFPLIKKTLIKLEWFYPDGTIHNDAPECVKEIHSRLLSNQICRFTDII